MGRLLKIFHILNGSKPAFLLDKIVSFFSYIWLLEIGYILTRSLSSKLHNVHKESRKLISKELPFSFHLKRISFSYCPMAAYSRTDPRSLGERLGLAPFHELSYTIFFSYVQIVLRTFKKIILLNIRKYFWQTRRRSKQKCKILSMSLCAKNSNSFSIFF